MPFVALQWDHKLANAWISWLVVECAVVEEKFGGPQAMPPRRDVAYFVCTQHAERDAKAFANFKNGSPSALLSHGMSDSQETKHAAFPWDHNVFNPLVQWAVLEWRNTPGAKREDIAYFLDPETAEQDARTFQAWRDGHRV